MNNNLISLMQNRCDIYSKIIEKFIQTITKINLETNDNFVKNQLNDLLNDVVDDFDKLQELIGDQNKTEIIQRLSINDFKQLGHKIHNNKYSYNKVEYDSLIDKVVITCPVHGDFYQRACYHIFNQKGCKQCKQKKE